MDNSNTDNFFDKNGCATRCKTDLSKYFHPENRDLNLRFSFIYKMFSLSDSLLGSEIGIDRTTMSRYRRGIFIPSPKMKLLIAQKISKLAGIQIDSSILWGDDWFFEEFKRDFEKKPEVNNGNSK